ncbi:YdcF family protein [Streptomyces sp. AV19]|uniref:YdcF family protein n=1 Tax=Streptomyces sp. AV19 TaxID=2793068 RepID=UPI0018FF0A2B|nr:YdcF family protein [Streptomyces sp. AV19]MBH1937096.1 YdcF family protein [Streptomyces sp. AV19]MDG4533122.1 YdcF family protein [Streptomyces sp. AV19]
MIAYAPAVLFLVLFAIGVLRDRRRFSNAVLLGLACISLLFALIVVAARAHDRGNPGLAWFLAALLLLIPFLGAFVLPALLVANGVKMIRKEGRSPANLLSFLAGLGIFGLIGLMVAAAVTGSRGLAAATGTLLLIAAYVSFLFFCFIGYAFLYGRLRPRRNADFVVVLGSGLIGGERVPPLLASRLERGRRVYEAQAARGRPPVLITSGGQGPDEKLPESHAMANYLTERGFPAEHILREDRSRTTEENLEYSKAIMSAAVPGYKCVIVTNNFHAFRAALMARRTGVDGQVVGSPTAAYFWPSATIREFVAVFLQHKAVNFTICGLIAALGALTGTLG